MTRIPLKQQERRVKESIHIGCVELSPTKKVMVGIGIGCAISHRLYRFQLDKNFLS